MLVTLRRPLVILRWRFWAAVTGCDIPLTANIGPGLLLPHPVGVVIHPSARIGGGCLVHQNVTIGVASAGAPAPVIGEHVDISAGAVVLADVGERAIIGANAVVTKPVPPGAVVAGAPARVIRMRGPAADRPALAAE